MSKDLSRLSHYLEQLGPAAVAVSGGVDSMTLAVVAHRVNPQIDMFHAISPAVPVQATERVQRYAAQEDWRLKLINAGEIDDPEYLKNPANRCFYCKTDLYSTIVNQTNSLVLSGTNLDDLGDYRPGLEAARTHQVCHPYIECEIDKTSLRAIAKQLELLDLHDLPAAPCLSSRVETGIRIDAKLLPVINEVEQWIWQNLANTSNISSVRCRIRATGVVLELDSASPLNNQLNELIQTQTKNLFEKAGYGQLAQNIAVEPYQRGSAFLIETLSVS